MPVYFLHGFKWPRLGPAGIYVHIIAHNLDECSPNYIQNVNSKEELLDSFHAAWPEIMDQLSPSPGSRSSGLQFIEQYDPDDDDSDAATSQPYAFVAAKVVTIAGGMHPNPCDSVGSRRSTATKQPPTSGPRKGSVRAGIAAAAAQKSRALSLNVEEVMPEDGGLDTAAWKALSQLRDHIAKGEHIGWYIVYNGDPERAYDAGSSSRSGDDGSEDERDKASTIKEEESEGEAGGEPEARPAIHSRKNRSREEICKSRRRTAAQGEEAVGGQSSLTPTVSSTSLAHAESPRGASPEPPLPVRTRPPQESGGKATMTTTANSSKTSSESCHQSPPSPSPRPSRSEGHGPPSPLSPERHHRPPPVSPMPSSKASGKRLPGMRASPVSHQTDLFATEEDAEGVPSHRDPTQPQQHPRSLNEVGDTAAPSSGLHRSLTGPEKSPPKVAPKSESLKKRLFGKRG